MRRCLISASHPNASLMPSTTKLASHRLPFLFLSTFDPHFNTMFCYTTEIKEERSPLHSADKRYHCHYARPQHRAPSTHFFSTLPFPTNPFFSPSNDKSTSTSSQSISSCTHPLQPSGLPLRPTHPRPFTSLTNQASHRITNSAPGVNSQRLPTQPRPIRRSTTNRIPQTRCLLPLHASRATRLKPYRASRISASCGVYLCLGMARYFRSSACRAWNLLFVRGGSGGRG